MLSFNMAAPLVQKVVRRFSLQMRTTWSTNAGAQGCHYIRKQFLDPEVPRDIDLGLGTAISLRALSCGKPESDSERTYYGVSSMFNPQVLGLDIGGPSIIANSSLSWRLRVIGMLGYATTAVPCCLVPVRHYGRKMRTKPPKVTHFEYSGDLRSLPLLDKSSILYTYRGIEDQLEGNKVVKRLSSLEFASSQDFANHRQELIRDRIMELFGPDSELEQRIALLTLEIRQMIPYCIQYRTDKLNKIWLLKRIFRRRRLLTKLRETDHERFEWLLRELKIRYVIPRDHEENKGWRHNLKATRQAEAIANQRKKLGELKEKFEEKKQIFHEHRAQVLAEIEKDLQRFGLSRNFLDQLQQVERETSPNQREISGINREN